MPVLSIWVLDIRNLIPKDTSFFWRGSVGVGTFVKLLNCRHWCRRRGCRGCKRTPKVLIWWISGQNSLKSVEILAKSLKTFTKSLKIWAKMAPRTTWAFFGGRSFFQARIRAKILCTPKHLPAATPMTGWAYFPQLSFASSWSLSCSAGRVFSFFLITTLTPSTVHVIPNPVFAIDPCFGSEFPMKS